MLKGEWRRRKPAVVQCATEGQWRVWAEIAQKVGTTDIPKTESGALATWCNDCTPEYQASENAAGRCFRGERPMGWYRGERREDAPPIGHQRVKGNAPWCVICVAPYSDACAEHPIGILREVAS